MVTYAIFFRLGVTLRFVAVIVFVDVNVNGILCGMDNKKLSVGLDAGVVSSKDNSRLFWVGR